MDSEARTSAAATASAAAHAVHPPPAAPAVASRASRTLRIDEYARAQTGVWYYQVDIEVRYGRKPDATGVFPLDACDEDDVQCYSVRRRYNEFLQLYEKVKSEIIAASTDPLNAVGDSGLPPFPQKEFISSSVLGMLWRTSSSTYVLEDRRAKFEALLRWIEHHSTLRSCAAFIEFLGKPPQVSEGYVSLKEYSSQNWLSSLEKLTKEKEKRRSRLSSDCSTCTILHREHKINTKKRRKDDCIESALSVASEPTKRRKRHTEAVTPRARSTPKSQCKKRQRARSSSVSDETIASSGSTQRQLSLCTEADTVAQVESNHIHKKKKIQ